VTFALGEGSSVEHLLEYYRYQGDPSCAIADGATRTATQAAATVAAYREAGADEFVFVPTMADLAQLDLLDDAVLPGPSRPPLDGAAPSRLGMATATAIAQIAAKAATGSTAAVLPPES
jgi:hypothetical protein